MFSPEIEREMAIMWNDEGVREFVKIYWGIIDILVWVVQDDDLIFVYTTKQSPY